MTQGLSGCLLFSLGNMKVKNAKKYFQNFGDFFPSRLIFFYDRSDLDLGRFSVKLLSKSRYKFTCCDAPESREELEGAAGWAHRG